MQKRPGNKFFVQIKDCSKVKKDDRRYCVRKISDIKRKKGKSTKLTCKYIDRIVYYYWASDISRKKEQNFAGFSGANSRKKRPISRGFRGKKVKIRRKIGRFRGILAEKSQISTDFRGQIVKKTADLTGNFGGKLRQETIGKKQPISLDSFLQISLKSINLAPK